MKIGIWLCGDVPQSLKGDFGTYADCLKREFELPNTSLVWDVYQQQDIPQSVEACDAYIIGGSPHGVNDGLPWVDKLAEFIQDAFRHGKRLFGVCFGHQVIHYALGGNVEKVSHGWGLGEYEVDMLKDFGHYKQGEKLALIAMHQDQVVETAPHFEVVAGNDCCPNYVTVFKQQVLTVQGHPEFDRDFYRQLVSYRQATFSNEFIALSKLKNNAPTHRSFCNDMVRQFLFSS